MGDKGSVMLVGSSRGDSAKSNQGGKDFAAVKLNTIDGPVQRLGEGGNVTNLSPFWEKTAQKHSLPGTDLTNPLVKCDDFGASLPTM